MPCTAPRLMSDAPCPCLDLYCLFECLGCSMFIGKIWKLLRLPVGLHCSTISIVGYFSPVDWPVLLDLLYCGPVSIARSSLLWFCLPVGNAVVRFDCYSQISYSQSLLSNILSCGPVSVVGFLPRFPGLYHQISHLKLTVRSLFIV